MHAWVLPKSIGINGMGEKKPPEFRILITHVHGHVHALVNGLSWYRRLCMHTIHVHGRDAHVRAGENGGVETKGAIPLMV